MTITSLLQGLNMEFLFKIIQPVTAIIRDKVLPLSPFGPDVTLLIIAAIIAYFLRNRRVTEWMLFAILWVLVFILLRFV